MSAIPFVAIDDSETTEGTIVSVELFNTLCTNINTLMLSMPVGTIIPVFTGLSGVAEPDSNIWEVCDGTPVANPSSPVRGRNKPDMGLPGNGGPEGPFFKGAANIGEAGNGNDPSNYGGSHYPTWLNHSHGGGTQPYIAASNRDDGGSDWFTWDVVHLHGIVVDLINRSMMPSNIIMKLYVKVI